MKQITPYPDLAPGERGLLDAPGLEVLPCSKNSVFFKFLSQRSTVHVSLQPERFLTDSALTHKCVSRTHDDFSLCVGTPAVKQ